MKLKFKFKNNLIYKIILNSTAEYPIIGHSMQMNFLTLLSQGNK